MNLNKTEIENLERKYRLNLINSISGIKPGNLIATKSENGLENVAVFSSVVHIGSSPAQLAFVLRPQIEKESDTYKNIISTEFYTINHIPNQLIEKAHYTSAKLSETESEFERINIEKEYSADFFAPYVKQSPVKIGLKLSDMIDLPNDCKFVIGTVEQLIFGDEIINDLGQLNLEIAESTGISGLNSYYSLKLIDTFPYVRNSEIPDFK